MASLKRKFRSKYRSNSQKAALAAFTFSFLFLGLVVFIVLSTTNTSFKPLEKIWHQDELVAQYIHKVDGRGEL